MSTDPHMDDVWKAIRDDIPAEVWDALIPEHRAQLERVLGSTSDEILLGGEAAFERERWRLLPTFAMEAAEVAIEKHRDMLVARRDELLRLRDDLTRRIVLLTGPSIAVDGRHRLAREER